MADYFVQTYSGERIPLNGYVDPCLIRIEDIANHLGKICRFSGAVIGEPYSVAQHSLLLSYYVPKNYALEGLLHDAAEAYTGDIITGIKKIVSGFGALEEGLENAIAARFGLMAGFSKIDVIKEADLRMLATEQRDLMTPVYWEWIILRNIKPYSDKIIVMGWKEATDKFLKRFYELTESSISGATGKDV